MTTGLEYIANNPGNALTMIRALATFYTKAQVDALISGLSGTYQPLDATLTTLSGKSTTGSGNIVLATSPTITTPTVASFANAGHNHADAAGGGKLAQANTHESPDTDTATTALHHTLGTGANQAAQGNHAHTGKTVLGTFLANSIPSGSTRYLALFGGTSQATEANAQMTLPFSGTLKNLYIRINTSQGGGGSLVATVMINGSPTGITITFAAGQTAIAQSDTTHTQSVSAGDLLDLRFVNNDGGAVSANIGSITIEFDYTVS